MAWYEISTAEIAPRQPLDAELFAKIRNNLLTGLSAINLPKVLPNGSFEYSTGTIPLLWTLTTENGSSAAIATGVHGANSLRLFHPNTTGARSQALTDDYIPVGGTAVSVNGFIWAAGATATAIKGGIFIQSFNSSKEAIATEEYNHSSWTVIPTTYTIVSTISSLSRFIKVGCFCATDSTVPGSLYFDGLYIV
jgi:hypothetical protein